MSEWFDQAKKKLEAEAKSGTFDRYGAVMKTAVRDSLLDFCRQDEEFAQAVAQGGSFADCMKAVAKNCGSSISDLERMGDHAQNIAELATEMQEKKQYFSPEAGEELSTM